ncbi:MAG TPA: NDP-sugar synthase [Solirubrobacterales bacterium]
MQALILAGGEGTRLRPLTYTVAKPVLPLAGRPHVAYLIDWLVRHGVDDVIVSCGHLAEGMRRALAELEPGVEIRYAEEPDARGTAGAIRFAADDGMLADRFLVLNGDVLCDLDLTALIDQHERTGGRATIALYPVAEPIGYGLVHRRDDGEITEFLEKPDRAQIDTDEINAGAYLLERSVLDLIPPDKAVSIEREVFPLLIGEGLYGIRLEGYWIDIGTPERYLEATWDILERRVETVTGAGLDENGLLAGDGVEIGVPGRLEGPAVIGGRTEISPGARPGPPYVLGRNCRIRPGAIVERSVLLDDCLVEDDAVVVNSILGSGVSVGVGAELDGAVIGDGERVTGTRADPGVEAEEEKGAS